jgi:hypothetical protein
VKYHPSSVDLELVKRLAAKTSRPTLLQFLIKEFSCIPKALAGAHQKPGLINCLHGSAAAHSWASSASCTLFVMFAISPRCHV